MSKKRKLPSLISKNVELIKTNDDRKKCNLKFSDCDENKCQLWNLGKNELMQFIRFAKKIENMEWETIKKSKGFHYEIIEQLKPPSNISKDITIRSLRVDKEFRIYGYRSDADFYIIWFDPYHKLT